MVPQNNKPSYNTGRIYYEGRGVAFYTMKPMNDSKNMESGPPEPLDAATVILFREDDGGPFEVFLMRRHKAQAFMGGAYVFPGGMLEEADCAAGLFAFGRGLSADEARLGLCEPDLPLEKALGLFFAAVRETFEESGVLLASSASRGKIDFSDHETGNRLAGYRRMLHEKKVTLEEMAESEDLRFSIDLLKPYSHWITPEIQPKRFDTRFLLARMPQGQVTVPDSIEMTQPLWTTPARALARQEAGEILLMPPTLKTMEELSEFSSIDEIFAAAASRQIWTILPQAFREGESFGLKLPHDPEYTIESYKQPPRPDETSRVVMTENGWRTVRADEL